MIELHELTVPILVLIAGGLIGLSVWGLIHSTRKEANERAEALSEDEPWTPPEPIAIGARVVGLRVTAGTVGTTKQPTYGAAFLVTFLTDDGERVEYAVPEELYITLTEDETGTLVTLNGDFFDFGEGEDAEPSA